MTEKHIRLAAQLYGARDAARLMLGDRYHAEVAPMIEAIQSTARDAGVSEAVAATHLATRLGAEASGAAAVTMLAAYVEMVEPSSEKPND